MWDCSFLKQELQNEEVRTKLLIFYFLQQTLASSKEESFENHQFKWGDLINLSKILLK